MVTTKMNAKVHTIISCIRSTETKPSLTILYELSDFLIYLSTLGGKQSCENFQTKIKRINLVVFKFLNNIIAFQNEL